MSHSNGAADPLDRATGCQALGTATCSVNAPNCHNLPARQGLVSPSFYSEGDSGTQRQPAHLTASRSRRQDSNPRSLWSISFSFLPSSFLLPILPATTFTSVTEIQFTYHKIHPFQGYKPVCFQYIHRVVHSSSLSNSRTFSPLQKKKKNPVALSSHSLFASPPPPGNH